MERVTRALLVCLVSIIITGALVITGCTPEPITTTATETLPPETITTTVIETTTLLSQPTIPNQIAQDLSVAEAYAMIQDNVDNPEFVILDIRTPEEHAAGYIEGSALIDKRSDTWLATVEALDRSYTYLIY